jgi:Flp pilus assembly protein TadD
MIDARNLDDDLFKSARSLIVSGQAEKGVEVVREFLRKNGGVWNAWFLLGWGLRLLGRYEDARAAFLTTAHCEGGKTSDTYNELAICCMEMNLLDESEAALKTALSLSPEDAKIMANMGVLLSKSKKTSEAQKWFRAALEYNPDDAVAKQALGG